MDKKRSPTGRGPAWIVEQIEAGLRSTEAPLDHLPAGEPMSREAIEELVSRTLEEELARIESGETEGEEEEAS